MHLSSGYLGTASGLRIWKKIKKPNELLTFVCHIVFNRYFFGSLAFLVLSFGKGCFRWKLRKLDAFFSPLSCIASQMSQARYFSRFLLVAISKLLNYSTSLPLMGAVSEKHWWPTLHWVFRQIFGADNS